MLACQFIPGTKTHSRRLAEKLASEELIDPSSSQFRNVRVFGTQVCGEVNGKNRMGAYVGFGRFHVNVTAKLAMLDPQFDPEFLMSAEDLCRSMRSNSYASAGATASACERAGEERVKLALQTLFDQQWNSYCRTWQAADPTAN